MPAYSYQALDQRGKKVKGLLEGDSERHVRVQLRGRQLKPIEVKSVKSKTAEASGDSGFSFFSRGPSLSYREVSLVTRQLSSLVQSGLPLDEVLQATAKQSRKANVKSIVLQVRSRVLEGLSLAQAMSEMPRVFDNLYRAMIRAGEGAGFLGPVLEQLAEYTEASQETRHKLKSAMIYPIVMLLICVGVVSLLMVKVVPQLTGLFERNRQELPGMTKFLISASDFFINYGIFVVIACVGLVALFQWSLRDPKRKKAWHRLLLKVPLFGGLILQSETARYSSTLGLLSKSGVPLLESLRIASQVLTNAVLQDASREVATMVQEGASFHKALDKVDVFPPLLVQMVASGEQNGRLDEQLLYAARNQERELGFSISAMMGLMEPAMILIMGGMVLFIVMAILLPIFQMNSAVG